MGTGDSGRRRILGKMRKGANQDHVTSVILFLLLLFILQQQPTPFTHSPRNNEHKD